MVQTEERRLVSTLEGMQVELLAQYYYSPSTLGPIQRPTHNFPIGSCSPVSWSYFSRKSHSVSLGFGSPLPIRSFRVLIISAASSSISSCPASSPSPSPRWRRRGRRHRRCDQPRRREAWQPRQGAPRGRRSAPW